MVRDADGIAVRICWSGRDFEQRVEAKKRKA
jgi:hypothetical protein